MRMPIASMFFFHSSSPWRCAEFGVDQRSIVERLAVGRSRIAVAVAILVAEPVEQRARGRRIVELRLRLQRRIVAGDVGRDRAVRRAPRGP